MAVVAYYGRWLAIAFRHSFGALDAASTLVGIVIPVLAKSHPDWKTSMEDLIWQIPIGSCVAVVAARLIAAPYWIHRKLEDENIALRSSAEATLRVGFDGNDPGCFQEGGSSGSSAMREWRLYVLNLDPHRTIKNIAVSLLAIDPPVGEFAIKPLCKVRTSDDGPSPLSQVLNSRSGAPPDTISIIPAERTTFDLDPGAHRYLYFVRWFLKDRCLEFETAPWMHEVSKLQVRPYRVSLRITAADMPVQLCDVVVTPVIDQKTMQITISPL